MNVTGFPRVPITPRIAEVSHPPSNEGRPGNAVKERKSETVDGAAVKSRPLEFSQKFNVQFLMLQQDMQMENRKFTTLSNVMKTKHSTASAAISNIK